MPSSLGLYIENNIIKYAKVSKERDSFKIESFGMKFYDNRIEDVVKQIINETYSFKTPICTNLTNEKYTTSTLFSLLNQKDLNKAAKTEFEYFCDENRKNKNAMEYRNLLVPDLTDKDKVISVYSYTDKSDIAEKIQILSGYKVNSVLPLPICIANLLNISDKKNRIIVNIEKNTTVTFVVNNKIYKVEQLETGMQEILDKIITKENSYAKAYEICKNTTIYTSQGRNLQIEENEYMEDIMPTLYNIIEQVKEVIRNSQIDANELYITGLAASINNIDLYFQENFLDKKCEILSPFFVQKTNLKLNIRDYIEVNSAISLALQGLGLGFKEINFKNRGTWDQINELLSMEIGKPSKNKGNSNKIKTSSNKNITANLKEKFKTGFDAPLDTIEINMIRGATALLILLIMYAISTNIITKEINKKETEVSDYISDSKAQITEIANNTRLVKERDEQYTSMIEKLEEANKKLAESYAKKNAIPNFLTQVMFNIPKEVQLTSIENTSGKSIKIEARSKEYEQLGYFIAKLKNERLLTNVTSTSGEKQDEFVLVTIQGDLPY